MEKHWKRYQKDLQKSPDKKGKKAVLFVLILGVGFFLLTGPVFQDSIQGITPEISKLSQQSSPISIHSDSVSFKRNFTPTFRTMEGGRFVEDVDSETRVVYTLDPVLQNEMEQLFARYRVPYGIFVAMDPTTGRILAMVEHSEDNPSSRHLALRATYPAASIFKLVTAADAMEKGTASPDTVIRYRGGLYEMNPKYWKDNPKRDRNKITLTDALAKSCNVAFAKIALRSLSAQDLRSRAVLFGFNRDLDFELPMDVSTIRIGA
ncbi:MAG: hypothetical protein HZA19_05135, partial [Nitrospirae bacterium]|nr:hypothetical protein [Nitrospirota bacterium]